MNCDNCNLAKCSKTIRLKFMTLDKKYITLKQLNVCDDCYIFLS